VVEVFKCRIFAREIGDRINIKEIDTRLIKCKYLLCGFPLLHIKIVSEIIRLLSDVDLNLEQNLPEVERRSRTLKIYKQQNRLNVKCKVVQC
jgi:hypothetical protein